MQSPQDSLYRQFSTVYNWVLLLVFGVPVVCGCLFTITTFFQAREDVQVWRREFQLAIDQQCPALKVDIVGGAGKVYLQAYQLDYQWIQGDLMCSSNGRTVRCSCATDITETLVSTAMDEVPQ
jgi:hypothetical protein